MIAPEPLTTVEINFYHHEVYCGKELIAYIAYDHDEFVTQPWLVMVNGKEQFRGAWRYALMPNKNSDELFHFQESQIQPLSPEELFSEITAEIELYQSQIAILQQQLAAITGGSTNG
ncbi:MAG: hypothetical protein V7K76_25150 [Nostoc sp.]|uniref:hypothetical protein n=1 Tax=Nostoc sp. TaxID=1180 RepID=UPI002FF5772F